MLDSSELRSGMLYLRDTRNIKQWQRQMQHYRTVNIHYFQIFATPSKIFHIAREMHGVKYNVACERLCVCVCVCVCVRACVRAWVSVRVKSSVFKTSLFDPLDI